MRAFLLGFAVGLFGAALVFAGTYFVRYQAHRDQHAQRWTPTQVLTVQHPTRAGQTLTDAALARTTLPLQFLGSGWAKPEDLPRVLGRTTSVDLDVGDPITLQSLAPRRWDEAVAACVKHVVAGLPGDAVGKHDAARASADAYFGRAR